METKKTNSNASSIKGINIYSIICIIVTIIGVTLTILGASKVLKTYDAMGYLEGLGFFISLFGLGLGILSIERFKKYRKNYKIAIYAMVLVNVVSFSSPIIVRIIDNASDPCMCVTLDTTIDWNTATYE